ncbi:flavin reductase family protein [Marinobacterium sp. D7]|uniref:flavin reductase family protein n=1 Tax=Marinobacterium ramblicola TaxID=2849041 RepID=UPI001C2D3A9D|nr:flavin reductase family protein [Marinobacterium ramblicola]MBV1789098.1 flavin reductase family protein [Marinobacterium ramblicola]
MTTSNLAVAERTEFTPANQIDPRELRNTLGLFATGVTVVTAPGRDGRPVGITANSFSSLSLDPPLVLWSLALKSPNVQLFQQGKPFAINILGSQHQELALQFARPVADKFQDVAYGTNVHSVPLLEGAQAHLECTVSFTQELGDHLLIVGRVDAFAAEPGDPLLFYRGAFARLQS